MKYFTRKSTVISLVCAASCQPVSAMPSLLQLLPCLLLASQGAALLQEPYQKEILTSMATKMVQMHEQLEKLESKNVELRMEMEKKAKDMEEKLEKLEAKNSELTTKLNEVDQKSLKEVAPFVMKCAAQYSWPTDTTSNLGQNQTITYDHISADFDNADATNGTDGNLDIGTGLYTALTAGIYEVIVGQIFLFSIFLFVR